MGTMNTLEILESFHEAAKRYGKFTIERNPKKANRAIDDIYTIALLLRDEGNLELLRPYLTSEDIATRMFAAVYLLIVDHQVALPVLEAIAAVPSPFSFESKITVQEWRKGSLKIFRD